MRISVKEFLISSLLGGVIGGIYYSLSWAYHLPYMGLNWLAPLVGADGEKGYDVMHYESVIDFAIAAIVINFLAKAAWSSIRSGRKETAHKGTPQR